MANEIQELKFQVGEAWKGVYNAATSYSLANVVQDATGLSIYRSLKSGNVGHPVTDTSWWFCIIDMSSIKAESDRITAINDVIARDEALRVAAEELRQQHEEARITAEQQRVSNEQARQSAENTRIAAEQQRASREQQRVSNEQSRVSAEASRVSAEQARVLAETLRANAEDARAAAENNRVAQEQQRVVAEQGRVDAEAQRVADFATQMQQQQTAYQEAEAARELAFETAETVRDEKVDEKVADITELQAKVAALEAVVADLETIAEGHVRVAGSSSPALSYKSYKYNEQGGFGRESVFSLLYPCLIGTKLTGDDAQVGKILHILKKLDFYHDIYGNARKIDGTEGDVLITNIEPYYRIIGKHMISGTEYDVFLMSRTSFTWQGIEAERVERGGVSPDYTVSHNDGGVTRMHSVYNPEWNGSYTAPDGITGKVIFAQDAETGVITETFDPDATLLGGAGGLHTTDKALYTGEQEAMNQNPDTTKMIPFANQTMASFEDWYSLMLAEGGTFDAHSATLMGSGFCANDPANAENYWDESNAQARNGMRLVDKDGVWKYYSLASDVKAIFGRSASMYVGTMVNSWRNPFHIMEAHRALCHAIQNGVHELEWFVFEGNKYKWRSVEGFAGPAQGEMTAVVWKLSAGHLSSSAVDPTDLTTSIAGNRIELLHSVSLFHGITTQVSPAWNMTGIVAAENENGDYACYAERDPLQLIITENGEVDASASFNFETRYKHILDVANGSGYAKDYHNEALPLPASNADKTGGGLHTYVCRYNYFTGTAAATGKKIVRAFRRGINAGYTYLSPLYVFGYSAPSSAGSSFAFGTCFRVTESQT